MKTLHGRLAAVLLLVVALLTTALATTADAATIQLSGRIEDQSGSLVPGSVLTFYDAVNDIEIMTIDATDGTYAAAIDDGIYDVVVEPPTGLGLVSMREDLVVLFADQSRDFVVPFNLPTSTIDGTVSLAGVGLPGAAVSIEGLQTTTNAAGYFSAEVPLHTVGVAIERTQDATTPAFTINAWIDGTNDVTLDFDLPPVQLVSVSIVDDVTGLPIIGDIYANSMLPPFAGLPANVWSDGSAAYVTTTETGVASVPVFAESLHEIGMTVALADGRGHYEPWNGLSTQELRVPAAAGSAITVDGTLTAGGMPLNGVEMPLTGSTTATNGGFSIATQPTDYLGLRFTNWTANVSDVPEFDVDIGFDPLPVSTTIDIDLPALTTLNVSIIDAVSGQPINAYARVNGMLTANVTGATPTHVYGTWHDDDQIASNIHSFAAFNDPTGVVFDIDFEGEYFQVPWDGQNPTTLSVQTSTKATLSTTVTAGGVPVTSVQFNGLNLNSPTGDYASNQPPSDFASFYLYIDEFDPATNLPTVSINGSVDLQSDVHVPLQLPAVKTYIVHLVDADTGLAVDANVAADGLMTVSGLDALELYGAVPQWSTNTNTFVGETTLTTFHDGTSPINIFVTGFGPTEFFTWSGDSETVTLPVRFGYPIPEVPFTTGSPDDNTIPIIGESLDFTILACENGTGEWTLSLFGSVVESGVLIETPTGSGEYRGSIPPIMTSGIYDLQSTVDCDGDGVADATSNQPLDYLDPSGQVFDCAGNPLQNVEVTLWRADNGTDPLVMVPDGSDIMSPANRANPSYTTATGYYRWDTIPGWYQVRATIPGVGTISSERLVVPPERFGVDLTFDTVNCVGVPTVTTPTTTTTPTAGTPTTTPTAGTPTTTTPRATVAPVRMQIPPPDPVVGEIIGGTLDCHTRMGTYDGEDVRMLVVDVPGTLAVWFDRDAKVSITGGGARFNDVLPYDGVVEIPLHRAAGEMQLSLRTTLITGASYSVTCPEPVTIPTAETP